jgi:hypothetical protein
LEWLEQYAAGLDMSELQQHKPFTKAEFEGALRLSSRFMEFIEEWYKTEWVKDKENKYYNRQRTMITEYCYIVPLTFNPTRILKVYSSVQKISDRSRVVGGDAIRVVLADRFGEPKHRAYTRINRTGNWEYKLRLRISEVLASTGFDISCPTCNEILFLKWNRNDNSRFLGCSYWPDCKGTRPFNDGCMRL